MAYEGQAEFQKTNETFSSVFFDQHARVIGSTAHLCLHKKASASEVSKLIMTTMSKVWRTKVQNVMEKQNIPNCGGGAHSGKSIVLWVCV